MTIKIEVFSDYVCPYYVLFEAALKEAAVGMEVHVEWFPFELRPEPTPTIRPEDEYFSEVWKQSVYPLADKLGVPIKLPTMSPRPQSRLAHEGYQFAKLAEKGQEYNQRVFKAFFQENRNIGNIDVLSQLAQEVGLNHTAFRTALETGEFSTVHENAQSMARNIGIRSVPSFFIEGQAVSGVYDPVTLRSMLRLIQQLKNLRRNSKNEQEKVV